MSARKPQATYARTVLIKAPAQIRPQTLRRMAQRRTGMRMLRGLRARTAATDNPNIVYILCDNRVHRSLSGTAFRRHVNHEFPISCEANPCLSAVPESLLPLRESNSCRVRAEAVLKPQDSWTLFVCAGSAPLELQMGN